VALILVLDGTGASMIPLRIDRDELGFLLIAVLTAVLMAVLTAALLVAAAGARDDGAKAGGVSIEAKLAASCRGSS
jgi:hypothetical protein